MGEFDALIGLEVEQVWVWSSLRLVFDLGPPGELGIFVDLTDFRFTDEAGGESDVRIEDDPLSAGPVLGLLRRRVTDVQIQDWELTIGFDNGARAVCRPHPRYEAWAVSLPDAAWYFCPPGGGPDSPA
ncbi:DUF6188 family protein [Nocardia aurea]|uniref:DUF6188 family protein n=1 Tax=Nocardia aurea TaxID=2144174 RepID=A0ABV3FY40_9NOCA